MHYVRVAITRMVDEGFPGWVECELVDASGRTWLFNEKIPIVSSEAIWTDSKFPINGFVGCTVLNERTDSSGRRIISIDTALPWMIESVGGDSKFEVRAEQISED